VTQTINEPPIVPLVTSTTILTKIIGSTTVYGKAVVTLTNETASPITGPMDITLFASGDGVINSSTAMLATPPARDWKIKPGATVKFDVPINVPSLPLSAGSYTLLARISYGNGQITNAATGPTLQVIAPVIALTDVLTVRHLPSAFISGTKTPGVATVHITNDGNIPSEGPVTISLSASTEQNVIRTTIISVTKKLSIKLDGSANVTIPLKAIPALDDGDYFIVVQTTDPQGNTSVTSTATTVHATAPVVSLSASVGSIDPTPVAHGQPVHLSIAITNSGNVDATGPITFAVGVSIDGQTVVATLVDLIGSLTFIPGTTKTLALTFEIPADATAGSFFPTVSINQNGSTASAIGRTQFTIV
jgi:hypothetical protein